MPRSRTRLPRRRLLALATLIALSPSVWADDANPPACPVGVFKCPKRVNDWGLCKKNDLLDFYVPGLPTEGDRSATPADFSAERVQSSDRTHYALEGEAEIRRLDQLLRADRITYDNETTAYTAEGHLRYQDRGLLMSADRAEGSTDLDQCTLDNARYQLLSSHGNGTANTAVLEDPDHVRLTHSIFTTCDLNDHQWELRARDMSIDQVEGVGRAHDVSFRLGNVPIFWLPYASFPIDDQRESGFLFPHIGYSDRRGLDFDLPYYLNLAPNYDFTLYPHVMSERGFMLGGEFRYLFPGSKGTVEFTYLPRDRGDNDNERHLFRWQDSTYFGSGSLGSWGAAIDINRVSDDTYFQDFGRSLNVAATSLLPSSAYLNGHGDWWTASFGADQYEITDPTLSQVFEPYKRLPRATFTGEHPLLGDLDWGVQSEFVAFRKPGALEGQRLDLFPYLSYPIETAAYFIRPQIGYRYTSYDLDRNGDSSPTRGVPIASLDAGLVFERSLNFGGDAYTQTLEPRLYYLRVPYRNQDDLPIFDTALIPFSFGQLFRTNSFVGADRQEDANNLTVALTSRLLRDSSGDELVSASIGQIRYFNDQRVQLPGAAATQYAGSDYVGEVNARLSERWQISLDQQWNPHTHQTDLSAIGLQHRFGDYGVLNLSYRFRRGFLEQYDVSAQVPVTPEWNLIGRWNYSVPDHKPLETFFGVEHDSCCIAWRVLARRYVHNVAGQSDTALYFEVEFKGLGATGQRTSEFLRRAILGYQ